MLVSIWPFGLFHGLLVYFNPFWYLVSRLIWQPWRELATFCQYFCHFLAKKCCSILLLAISSQNGNHCTDLQKTVCKKWRKSAKLDTRRFAGIKITATF
jgi:hypothetical protein